MPVSIDQVDQSNESMLKGILSQMVGKSQPDQKAELEAVSEQATDLSSLVRRKPATHQASKRPVESDDSTTDGDSKRARVEDAST